MATTAIYTSLDAVPDTAAALRATLSIGATPPADFAKNTYTKCVTSACTAIKGVNVYVRKGGKANTLDADTIFELKGMGQHSFFLNRVSKVKVGDSPFSFRNAPTFMSFVGEHDGLVGPAQGWLQNSAQPRQVEYETEALIDHLLYHQNTAPYIAKLLIQRMVTSNPSPRYVSAVATAFRTGVYNGKKYSGQIGDMAATVSAILLDREARSPLIEADPTFGKFREPLLKVLAIMRSLQYEPKDDRETELDSMEARIGMAAFESKTVFSE